MKKITAHGIPFLSFCGYSNSGKTTLLSRVIPLLKEQGLRVAVVKHDGHEFQIDRPGTDTFKFADAGADIVAIASPSQFAYLEKREQELPVWEILDKISGADVILIEGYKKEHLPKILVSRTGISAPENVPQELILAEVTDDTEKLNSKDYPIFAFSEIQKLCDFILGYIH